ncbi:hypothetical protein FOL47_003563 [Perkinsus chesapeaki]|uniref:Uncharacterized protein n=1 Tax=Perkinsus chesapeaki TaxID=330153 RepID=A0A7J6M7N3_PERCH|nr:hypothetical protein FOL47_003563 [Perkinsus chesapeaki]
MRSASSFICRLLVAIQVGLQLLVLGAPDGKYCGKVGAIFSISLTFHGDTFDLDAKYLAYTGSAQNVPYSMPQPDKIRIPLDNPDLNKAFDDLKPPIRRADLEYLDYVNDQITAHTSLGSLTLAKDTC